MSVSPGLGAALDDAVAVAPDRSGGVAAGRVVPPVSTPAIEAASVSAPARGGAGPALAVAPAQALSRPAATPVSSPIAKPAVPPPEPEPVAAVPEPAPTQASPAPVVAGLGGGQGSPGPIVGGVNPPPSCEGDEYTLTVSLDGVPGEDEDIAVKILVQRLESNGTVSELELEGDLSDVGDLADLLESEGNCVQVVFEPPLDEESVQAPSESGSEPTELGDALDPTLP